MEDPLIIKAEQSDRDSGKRYYCLQALALEYHRRTEQFDRSVCTGPVRNGAIMPANAHESALINRHAKTVDGQLRPEVISLGFGDKDWRQAIHDALRFV